jgi:hypothetical protein
LPFADAFRKAGNPSIPAPNSGLSDKKPQTHPPKAPQNFSLRATLSTITARPQAFIGDENAGCAPAFHFGKERAMSKPRRFKLTQSLKDRLGVFARLMRERAEAMPLGVEKAATPAKAEQAEFEADAERWVNSPELRPPK